MSRFDRLRRKPEPATNHCVEPDDDALRPEELHAQGGTWNGLLFDNPSVGLPPSICASSNSPEAKSERQSRREGISKDSVFLRGASTPQLLVELKRLISGVETAGIEPASAIAWRRRLRVCPAL
jgi:hypothetical protein